MFLNICETFSKKLISYDFEVSGDYIDNSTQILTFFKKNNSILYIINLIKIEQFGVKEFLEYLQEYKNSLKDYEYQTIITNIFIVDTIKSEYKFFEDNFSKTGISTVNIVVNFLDDSLFAKNRSLKKIPEIKKWLEEAIEEAGKESQECKEVDLKLLKKETENEVSIRQIKRESVIIYIIMVVQILGFIVAGNLFKDVVSILLLSFLTCVIGRIEKYSGALPIVISYLLSIILMFFANIVFFGDFPKIADIFMAGLMGIVGISIAVLINYNIELDGLLPSSFISLFGAGVIFAIFINVSCLVGIIIGFAVELFCLPEKIK